jgi:hypothetical protein
VQARIRFTHFLIRVIIIVEHAIVIMKWRTALFPYRQKYTVLFKCSSKWAVGFVWCPSSVFKLSYFDISETTEAIFFPISARRSIGLSIYKNADRSTFCTFSQKWIKLLLIFTIIAQIACLEILSIQPFWSIKTIVKLVFDICRSLPPPFIIYSSSISSSVLFLMTFYNLINTLEHMCHSMYH